MEPLGRNDWLLQHQLIVNSDICGTGSWLEIDKQSASSMSSPSLHLTFSAPSTTSSLDEWTSIGRGRSPENQSQSRPFSPSSIRSMIDERLAWAQKERANSISNHISVESPSPFQQASPFYSENEPRQSAPLGFIPLGRPNSEPAGAYWHPPFCNSVDAVDETAVSVGPAEPRSPAIEVIATDPGIPRDDVQRTDSRFVCSSCDASFTRAWKLRSHLLIHTGVKPFQCDYEGCGRKFRQQGDMTRHRDNQHGEKRYRCGGILPCGTQLGCGRLFARKDGLLEHQRRCRLQKGQSA